MAQDVDEPIFRSEPTHCLLILSAESKIERVVQAEKYSTRRRVIVALSAVIEYIRIIKLKPELMSPSDFSVINFFES